MSIESQLVNDSYPIMPKTVLVVVGMHRSGTSALTRILNLLGAQLPDNLMAAHSKFNPTGFWESKDVVSINDRLLESADSRWDEIYDLDISALPQSTKEQFYVDVRRLLECNFALESCIVIKDPRIARTLPIWIDVLRSFQYEIKIIIPVRHPFEVAASLARRDGFSFGKSVYLWLRYVLDSIRHSVSRGYSVTIYDELIHDWRVSIERLRQELKITWPTDVVTATPAINEFLNGNLRHHQISNSNSASQDELINPIIEFAVQLYDALLQRAPDLSTLANEIHTKMAVLEAGFMPVITDYRRQRQDDITQQKEVNLALVRACRNVDELEQVLRDERKVYKKMEEEFNTKCTHVLLLQDEIAALQQKIDGANPADGCAKTVSTEGINTPYHMLKNLKEIEFLVREKLNIIFRQEQIMELKQQEFRDEITRAEAQLNLLKDLFLNR